MESHQWFLRIVSSLMVVGVVFIAACNGPVTTPPAKQAQNEAINRSQQRNLYIPTKDIEFNNYNERQKLADDPTAILWCTTAFPFPGTPLFTVPIVGKLTSGNKRPYPTSQVHVYYASNGTYNPELPGSDGMYGSSGEYRYGFTPAKVYVEFYNMPTYCTTEPSIWQKEKTELVLQSDPSLLDAQKRAQQALVSNNPAEAQRILEQAISKSKGGG